MNKLKKILLEDGNEYIVAASRIAEFRSLHPMYTLVSSVHTMTESFVLVISEVRSGQLLISNGFCARTVGDPSDINAAETISKSRAIANMGIGIDDQSIASAEEIQRVILQTKMKDPSPSRKSKAQQLKNEVESNLNR